MVGTVQMRLCPPYDFDLQRQFGITVIVHLTHGVWCITPTAILQAEIAKPQLRRLARKRNFNCRVRQNNPTGKSLLIFRNRVKP